MTDRELLEMAAKSIGGAVTASGTEFHHALVRFNGEKAVWWSPLSNDGDAFRLLVKLNLVITVGRRETHVEGPGVYAYEEHGGGPCAATRLAIVRAAAEIGKWMK